MKRVEENGDWSLFCPNEAPGLADVWGAEFEELYCRYEREGRAKKTIKAQQLWFAIMEAQVSGSFRRATILCQVFQPGSTKGKEFMRCTCQWSETDG
jgi:hypothetical protein